MNPKVDFFFAKAKKWQNEVELLRQIVLETPLNEELKWGCPCYTYEKSNVVLIHHFKEYCALLFMKGALMKNDESLLIQQTENVQSARQMRFTSVQEIEALKPVILSHVLEALELEKSGAKVEMKKTKEFDFPEELTATFEVDEEYKTAFYALTPGRQRGYLLHFSSAKQEATRIGRIEKARENVFAGIGFNERK